MDEASRVIGATPLVKLEKLSKKWGAEIYAKYEAANPGASIKDRAARCMIDQAEKRGIIKPGESTLVEPTSGNTGIAIAMIGAARGYKVILTMPESMSFERRALLAAYGAQLCLTPAKDGMAGAVSRAEQIVEETPGAWIVGQFTNPDNPLAHELTTAPEIHKQLGCIPDAIVAGVGTGGTISGNAHYFLKQDPHVGVFAVEPAESPLISQHLKGEELKAGAHNIQGIGANFIPEALDLEALTDAVAVTTQAALDTARSLPAEEGFLVGISSGANLAAVKILLETRPELKGKKIVTFLVDTGERYLSTALFEGIA